MTPKEFKAQMQAIFHEYHEHDAEVEHARADELMEKMLRALGYNEGMDIYDMMTRWYA